MAASGEESGEGFVKETENEAASGPVKELQSGETVGYETGETGEDKGFWLTLIVILGVGVLGMAGLTIAHSIKKFD